MKGFPKTVSILALPLFIEGVPRRGEGVHFQFSTFNFQLLKVFRYCCRLERGHFVDHVHG